MGYQTFMDLDAWKRARKFKLQIYALLKRFPEHERYELTSQLRRAARSIPTNISEGHGRRTAKDQANFCVIARGSHSEAFNRLIDAFDCSYLSADDLRALKDEWEQLEKVLNGYMSFIQSKTERKPGSSTVEEPSEPYNIADTDSTSMDIISYLQS